MTTDTPLKGPESFEDKLKARLAEKGMTLGDVKMPGTAEKENPVEHEFMDDVPDIEETELHLSDEEQAIDDAIKGLSIIDAYNRWSGKKKVSPRGGQKEGIKISCPDPNHKDEDPSAWANTEKNLYNCGGCEYGGDVWDIAAFHFGYPVPGYKADNLFRELREKVAADLGFSITKSAMTGSTVYTVDEPEHTEVAKSEAPAREARDYYKYNGPTIDWREIVPPQTFLWDWLQATTKDNCPEEFHFWTGLMAIGYAIGREVTLSDEPEVTSNLFICLTGPTSVGKSKAKRHLRHIVEEALPYKDDDPLSLGVKIIGTPGSGEYMVNAFNAPIYDPANPKKIIGSGPVRGYIDFEEFSSLAAVANRSGSTLKQQLLDVFDCPKMLVSGSLTHGARKAYNPYGQVISSTQPDAMAKFISKDDDVSGFVNRWVFALGKPKRVQSWGAVTVDFTTPKNSLKRVHMWGSTRRVVTMSDEAMQMWDDFFHDTILPMKMAAEQKNSGIIARVDLILKKLILLFAANNLEMVVTEDTVKRVLELFPYLIGTSGHTEMKINRTDDGDLSQLILDKIEQLRDKNGVDPTKREIYLACRSRIKTDDQMVKVLKNMITLDLITETAYKPKTGRPTIRYSIGAPEDRTGDTA